MRSILFVLLFWPGLVAAQCVVPANGQAMAQGIYSGVNAQRNAQNLRGLAPDRALAEAAQIHACDIARTGEITHRGSDGTNSHRRVERAGFDTCLTAENLAWGFPDPGQIMSGWMNSDGHRRNILLDRTTSMGVGIAQGPQGPMWVLVLSRRC